MAHRLRSLALLSMFALLGACSSPDSPEAQVRRLVAQMEQAAEARKVSEVMEFVSDDFRDPYGQGASEIARYLHGYFIVNQSLHLLTRIEDLEFPSADEARLKVTVGSVSREADTAAAWNLAADIRDFDVTLRRRDGHWKVTYAKWRSE